MTVQQFYEKVGGDYNDVMSRLMNDDRIIKFVGIFARDQNYQLLMQSLEDQDVDTAFRAAHTMKGMCQNMAFTRLLASSVDITEALRAKDLQGAMKLKDKVTEDYNLVMEGITELTAK